MNPFTTISLRASRPIFILAIRIVTAEKIMERESSPHEELTATTIEKKNATGIFMRGSSRWMMDDPSTNSSFINLFFPLFKVEDEAHDAEDIPDAANDIGQRYTACPGPHH